MPLALRFQSQLTFMDGMVDAAKAGVDEAILVCQRARAAGSP
jgi:hypothetical protein